MKLHLAALVVAVAASGFALSPAVAATTSKAGANAAAMTAGKPAMSSTMKMGKSAPDAKRFSAEAAAQASCPGDTVVWANAKSKIFHLKGTATYGKGKNGVYMCQTAATGEGFRATKKPEKQISSK